VVNDAHLLRFAKEIMNIRLSSLLLPYPLLYTVLGGYFIAFVAGQYQTGSMVGLALQAGFIFCTLLLWIADFPKLFRQFSYFIPVLILPTYILISAVWSIDPGVTARRAVSFFATTILACFFAATYPPRRQLRILNVLIAAVALGCAFVSVFLPGYGTDHSASHFGNWQGLYDQKNGMAAVMVEGLTLTLLGRHHMGKLTFWLLLLLYTLLLVESGSREAWIASVGVVLVYISLLGLSGVSASLRTAFVTVGIFVVAIGSFVISSSAGIFQLLGRNADLTGRTAIWSAVWSAIKLRPLLGYGFDAFWMGRTPGVRTFVQLMAHGNSTWQITSAHNGILQMLLELGAVGLALIGMLFLRIMWRGFHHYGPDSSFAIVIVASIVFNNIAETYLLTPNSLEWFLLVLVELNLAARLSAPAQPIIRVSDARELQMVLTN
jgi:O-antigen ligase